MFLSKEHEWFLVEYIKGTTGDIYIEVPKIYISLCFLYIKDAKHILSLFVKYIFARENSYMANKFNLYL